MGRFFVPNTKNSYLRGIMTIALGSLLLFVPGLTMQTVMVAIGVMLLLSGLVTLILSNRKRTGAMNGIWSAQGIMTILFGTVFIASPSAMIKVFVIFLGIILLILGFFQLIGSLSTLTRSAWAWIFFLMAVLTLTGGIFLLTDPFKSAEKILPLLGVLLILNGISELFSTWKVGRQPKTYNGTVVEDVPFEEV
jgi:uncharacterized membrane protein HdeD (DUF308 family)